MMPGRVRIFNLAAAVLCGIGAVLWLITGHLARGLPLLLMMVLNLGCFAAITRAAARLRVASRPRPDYALIAAMEREVYGEAFRHDGAPEGIPGTADGASGVIRYGDWDREIYCPRCRDYDAPHAHRQPAPEPPPF